MSPQKLTSHGRTIPSHPETFSCSKQWTLTEWNQHQNSFCLVNPNISVASQANDQSLCFSCVNYNFLNSNKASVNITLIS